MLKKNKTCKTTFVFNKKSESPVFLVGDFNNWQIGETPLEQIDEDQWQVTIDLQNGSFSYKYFSDGDWHNDDNADEYTLNPYGEKNSVVNILV